MPASLWIIFFAGIAAAITAVIVAWRSNVNSRQYLDDQMARGWQQLVRQLKHEADQRGKQRVHETEQLSKQLEHDAEHQTKELQHSLRRDTYLEAAAALLNVHALIARVATAECDEALLSEWFADYHARIVKAHLIATESTVEALMVYMNELAPAFVELISRRRQIRAAAQGGEQVEFLRRSISLTTQSAKSLAAALLALRSEMGGPFDPRRYEQLWQIQFGKMEPVWKEDIERLRPSPAFHPPDLVNQLFP